MELKGQRAEQPVSLLHASYFLCVSVEGCCDGAEGVQVTETSPGTSPEGLLTFTALTVYLFISTHYTDTLLYNAGKGSTGRSSKILYWTDTRTEKKVYQSWITYGKIMLV